MKYIVLLLLTTYSLFALNLHKGWQLVGLNTYLDDIHKLDKKEIDQVWTFDAKVQQWKGYSPKDDIQTKISNKGYEPIDIISASAGVWIKANANIYFNLSQSKSSSQNSNDLTLYKEWNLVSLPQDSSIKADFFGDDVVWQYNDKWKLHAPSIGKKEIDIISSDSGIWVKSDKEISFNLSKKLSKLRNFSNLDELNMYIKDMIKATHRVYKYGYVNTLELPVAKDAVDDGASQKNSVDDATSTNLQENDVDEADIFKHNGEYIFYIDNSKKTLNISSFDQVTTNNTKELVNSIDLNSSYSVSNMYLNGTNIILVYQDKYDYKKGTYYRDKFSIDIYDFSDINNIKKTFSSSVDGSLKETRLVNDKLYVISTFTPKYNTSYKKIYIENNECKGINYYQTNDVGVVSTEVAVKAPSLDYVEPNNCYGVYKDDNGSFYKYDYKNPIYDFLQLDANVSSKNISKNLFNPKKFYAPSKLNQTNSITSVSTFSVKDASFIDSVSTIGYVGVVYMSSKNLYLTSNQYNWWFSFIDFESRTKIYKFSLEDLDFSAMGDVEGRVINQFALSEYADTLRAATTKNAWWFRASSKSDNMLFTLKENNSNELVVDGELRGLGHEGESIKAVRFVADKAFVVTFRQTDPLYTIDLNDTSKPKVLGELKIDGFSQYIHPIDKNRLLSIGRDADSSRRRTGLSIQLFDISDLSKPRLASKVSIGDSRTYSEAEYNHKAFVYRASDKLFAFPYVNYDYSKSRKYFNSLGVYKVDNLKIVHKMDINSTSTNSWNSGGRGVIFNKDNKRYSTYFKGSFIMSEEIK